MTRLVSDSEHMDHVTILLARVCAARLDTTISADDFVRKVARLVDVAVAEAIEDLGPLPHLRVSDSDRIPPGVTEALKAGARDCPYCHLPVATMIGHRRSRMIELGLGEQSDDQLHRGRPVARASGMEPQGDQNARDSSTGATEAEANAALPSGQPETDVTAETPSVAPSQSRLHETSEDGSSLIDAGPSPHSPPSGLGSPGAAPPMPTSAAATDTAAGAPRAPSSPPIAEPASSCQPSPSENERDGDDAGTPAAGPVAGEQGSQVCVVTVSPHTAKLLSGIEPVSDEERASLPPELQAQLSRPTQGGPNRLTDEQKRTLRDDCLRVRRANGGRLPVGWIGNRADALKVPYYAVYNVLNNTKALHVPVGESKADAPKLVHLENEQQQGAQGEVDEPAENESTSSSDPPGRTFDHTHALTCWCRELPEKERCELRRGAPSKLTDSQKDKLASDYRAAVASNGGRMPAGWVAEQAELYEVAKQTIYRLIDALPTASKPEPKPAMPSRAPGMREHTNKADCWCRRLPANQWCTATTLPAALRTPRPRNERYRRLG